MSIGQNTVTGISCSIAWRNYVILWCSPWDPISLPSLCFLGGHISSNDVWVLSSQLNVWIKVACLQKGRWRHKMATLQGKVGSGLNFGRSHMEHCLSLLLLSTVRNYLCVCLLSHLEMVLMGEQLGRNRDIKVSVECVLSPETVTKEVVTIRSTTGWCKACSDRCAKSLGESYTVWSVP